MQSERENRSLRRARSMGALPVTLPPRAAVRPDLLHSPQAHSHSQESPLNHAHAHTGSEGTMREPPPGFVGKILVLLGHAGPDAKARRAFVSMIFSMSWWFAQFVVVIVLSVFSAHHETPQSLGMTEWAACDRPLGPWNALWVVRTVLGALLTFWGWQRGRAAEMITRREHTNDTERAPQRVLREDTDNNDFASQRVLVLNGRTHYPPSGGPSMTATRQQSRRTAGPPYEGTSGTGITGTGQTASSSILNSRLSLCTTIFTLAWFLTAHVLEYTSVHTCRLTSPHLWWLTFGILCTLYLEVLEVFLLGLLVIVIGPVIYLMYNIMLLCMGRHPLQNPHFIKPDIDKLPKSTVDQIPLVLYIPPPPGEPDSTSPITVPPAAHAYPPKSAARLSATVPKRRFAFFRRKGGASKGGKSAAGRKADADPEKNAGLGHAHEKDEDEEDVPWDEMWEKGEYPFVRLEGNRAVCAICLMDFEEPKRVRGVKVTKATTTVAAETNGDEEGDAKGEVEGAGDGGSGPGDSGGSGVSEIQVEAVTEEERDAMKLNDAGEGPLRLLSCGHVFHQTCLDPWLTNVSGRCPICQRPVEIPVPTKKGKRRQSQRT